VRQSEFGSNETAIAESTRLAQIAANLIREAAIPPVWPRSWATPGPVDDHDAAGTCPSRDRGPQPQRPPSAQPASQSPWPRLVCKTRQGRSVAPGTNAALSVQPPDQLPAPTDPQAKDSTFDAEGINSWLVGFGSAEAARSNLLASRRCSAARGSTGSATPTRLTHLDSSRPSTGPSSATWTRSAAVEAAHPCAVRDSLLCATARNAKCCYRQLISSSQLSEALTESCTTLEGAGEMVEAASRRGA
jgi:hypothetical protein